MIELVSTRDSPQLERKLERIRARSVALDAELMRQVSEIVEEVRKRGSESL